MIVLLLALLMPSLAVAGGVHVVTVFCPPPPRGLLVAGGVCSEVLKAPAGRARLVLLSRCEGAVHAWEHAWADCAAHALRRGWRVFPRRPPNHGCDNATTPGILATPGLLSGMAAHCESVIAWWRDKLQEYRHGQSRDR